MKIEDKQSMDLRLMYEVVHKNNPTCRIDHREMLETEYPISEPSFCSCQLKK